MSMRIFQLDNPQSVGVMTNVNEIHPQTFLLASVDLKISSSLLVHCCIM